jgi:hypothetical protein
MLGNNFAQHNYGTKRPMRIREKLLPTSRHRYSRTQASLANLRKLLATRLCCYGRQPKDAMLRAECAASFAGLDVNRSFLHDGIRFEVATNVWASAEQNAIEAKPWKEPDLMVRRVNGTTTEPIQEARRRAFRPAFLQPRQKVFCRAGRLAVPSLVVIRQA